MGQAAAVGRDRDVAAPTKLERNPLELIAAPTKSKTPILDFIGKRTRSLNLFVAGQSPHYP